MSRPTPWSCERVISGGHPMSSLGVDDPEVAEMLRRALGIIDGPIEDCWSAFLTKKEESNDDSELVRLYEAMPRGHIDLTGVIDVGLESGHSCLHQISYLVQNPIPTTPVVLQALLRVALVGAARALYVLLPTEPAERLERAHLIVARDVESGRQGLTRFAAFGGMQAFAAPQSLVEEVSAHRKEVWSRKLPGEGTIVDGMGEAIYAALELAGLGKDFGYEFLKDHVTWLWNTYSGLVHAHFWPRLLPTVSGDRRVPGDFPLDLHQVATAVHMALLATLSRMEPGSSTSTAPIPDSWPTS